MSVPATVRTRATDAESQRPLDIVIIGLAITSSWGNGHATTYRGLVRGLAARGHRVLFLERNVPWYEDNRDLANPPYCRVGLYDSVRQLRDEYGEAVRQADAVIVGSYVPGGTEIGDWVTRVAAGVTAFYDIDTPVTLARLAQGENGYISADLVPRYDLYLSFTGGPTLGRIEREFGAPAARALFCGVDPSLYYPEPEPPRWDLAYMGTYSPDRQPGLHRLLLEPARAWSAGRFAVIGPQYPFSIEWPETVLRVEHLAPRDHRAFYNSQRFTLNLTRENMVAAGWSPSVRLFEAAAAGTPIITDAWAGLEEFFEPGKEILVAHDGDDVLRYLREMDETTRCAIGRRARARVLAAHTGEHRAADLERYVRAFTAGRTPSSGGRPSPAQETTAS